MNKTIISIIVIILLLGVGYFVGSKTSIERIESIRTDTLIVYKQVIDTVHSVRYSYRYIQGVKVNIDSLWLEAKAYWKDIIKDSLNAVYVASIDTTYQDSLLTAKVSYISPIPLHPRSYFAMDFKVKERTIETVETVVLKDSFWKNRFIVYVGAGINYNTDLRLGLQMGAGIRIF
jgi:hypothetical protein